MITPIIPSVRPAWQTDLNTPRQTLISRVVRLYLCLTKTVDYFFTEYLKKKRLGEGSVGNQSLP